MKEKLILFDIDGTLLKGENKPHLESFDYAFQKVWKLNASIHEIQHSGKTEPRIITEVLEKHGIKRDKIKQNLPKTYRVMVNYFKRNINLSKQKINPGVKKLLSKLKEKGHVLGIVSGNLSEIAKLKLRGAGILRFFDVGGFGEVSKNRFELVREAVKQAEEKFRQKFSNDDIFIIGDTPFDIVAGKKNGVKTIVVSSGRYSVEELKKYNPDYFFQNFENYKTILNVIET